MNFVPVVASLLLQAPITPVGSPEEVNWGKNSGYVSKDADGVSFQITGPTTVLLTLHTSADSKGKGIALELLRDQSFVSRNSVKLKAGGPAPKGQPLMGKLGFAVPAGLHTYKISAGDQRVVIMAAVTKKVPKPITAAAEVAVGGAASKVTTATASEPAPAEPPEPPPAQAAATPPAPPVSVATTNASSSGVTELAAISASGREKGPSARSAPAAKPGQALRLAVYDFALDGIEPTIGSVVTDSMLAEVRKLQGVSAIGMAEIRDMLSHEASKQLLGCESNESCLAEIGGALGVDELVTGKLVKAGDEHVFVATRIDQKRAQVAGAVNRHLKAESGQEFLAAIGPAVEELFPDRDIREGTTRGVPKEVALRLDPPPLPAWSFWTTAGGAVVVGAAGGVFGWMANSAQKDYDSYAKLGVPADQGGGGITIEGPELQTRGNTLKSRAFMANTLFISAGVMALAAGVMYLFTDFEGYAEANLHQQR